MAKKPARLNTAQKLARQSFETTPGMLRALGDAQPVRYFRVDRPPGTLEGLFWLGMKDHLIGFIPADPAVVNQWGGIVVQVLKQTNFDGREAFKFWSEEGNGITWDAGPIEEAADLDALRAILEDLRKVS